MLDELAVNLRRNWGAGIAGVNYDSHMRVLGVGGPVGSTGKQKRCDHNRLKNSWVHNSSWTTVGTRWRYSVLQHSFLHFGRTGAVGRIAAHGTTPAPSFTQ